MSLWRALIAASASSARTGPIEPSAASDSRANGAVHPHRIADRVIRRSCHVARGECATTLAPAILNVWNERFRRAAAAPSRKPRPPSARQIDARAAAPPTPGAEAVLLLVEIVKLDQQLAQGDGREHRDDDQQVARGHGPAR